MEALSLRSPFTPLRAWQSLENPTVVTNKQLVFQAKKLELSAFVKSCHGAVNRDVAKVHGENLTVRYQIIGIP